MEALVSAAPSFPQRVHYQDGDDAEKPTVKYYKQSISVSGLSEEDGCLQHGLKPFLKLKHPNFVYHADFNSYTEQFILVDNTHVHFWTKSGQYVKSLKVDSCFTNFVSIPRNEYLVAWSPGADHLTILDLNFRCVSNVPCSYSICSVTYNESTNELLTGCQGSLCKWGFRKLRSGIIVCKAIITEGIYPKDKLRQLMLEDVIGNSQRCFAASQLRVYIIDVFGGKVLMCLESLHQQQITTCMFVSNLTFLVSGSSSGSIKVWNDSWKLEHVFVGHCDQINQLIYFVPDNSIISCSQDKTIRLWSLTFMDMMQCVETWSTAFGMGLLPDHRTLYSFSDQGIEVWDMNSLHYQISTLPNKIKHLNSSVSPCVPIRVVAVTDNRTVEIVSPVTGEVLDSCIIADNKSNITHVCYVENEGFIYCLAENGDILVYITSGNPCKLQSIWKAADLKCTPSCLAIYEYLVDATPYTEADLDNLQVLVREDQCMKKLLVQHGGQANQNILLAGCEDGSLVLFNRRYSRVEFKLQGHECEVVHMACNTGESRVITSANDNVIRVWRMYPFAEEALAPMFSYYTAQTPKHLISGMERIFCSYENPKTCTFVTVMYDINSKKKKYRRNSHDSHTASITDIAVCERQELFASAAMDNTIKIWDTFNKLIVTLKVNTIVTAITFGNLQGDILLAAQRQIRKIEYKSYLPQDLQSNLIGQRFPVEVKERPVPKSRGSMSTISVLDDTLPSGVRVNSHKPGYISQEELQQREEEERAKKAEIAKLMKRNYELEQLSQGKYETRKCLRKTKKMRDEAFSNYFNQMYPKEKDFIMFDDEELFDKGSWIGEHLLADVGRRSSLVLTPVESRIVEDKWWRQPLPFAPDGFKPNSCIRRQFRTPTPPPKPKRRSKEWKLQKLSPSQMKELSGYLGDDKMFHDYDWISFVTSDDEEDTLTEETDSLDHYSLSPSPPIPKIREKRKIDVIDDPYKDDDEDDIEPQPSEYMTRLNDVMSSVILPPDPVGKPKEPEDTIMTTPSQRQLKPVNIQKYVSRPSVIPPIVSREKSIPKIPSEASIEAEPLPSYVALLQDEPWFSTYLPSPEKLSSISLAEFITMLMDTLNKAAFYVKSQICQALQLLHSEYGIPIPTDVKLTILLSLNAKHVPKAGIPDEKQFIVEALKLLQKLNVMDEGVVCELIPQFIDGDNEIRSLVMAILKSRGLMNDNTFMEDELDSWETWKIEGDADRKDKLVKMTETWIKDWTGKYTNFMSNIAVEAKKWNKTISDVMAMLSSPGTSPVVSILNFFIFKCKHREESSAAHSPADSRKTKENARNAVISMPVIRKKNLMRLGDSHVSKCYADRETTLSRFLPVLDLRSHTRLNMLLHGFTNYINLALRPINLEPFSKPETKRKLRDKSRPKSLNLLSSFRYFIPDMSVLSISEN